MIFALALAPILGTSSTGQSADDCTTLRLHSWERHPQGRTLVEKILRALIQQGDVQSVAALSSLLHEAEEEVKRDMKTTSGQVQEFEILPAQLLSQCGQCVAMYTWILSCRGLLMESATTRSRCWPASRWEEVDNAPLVDQTERCNQSLTLCSVCRLPVRGLSNTCALCGHMGHTDCLRSWFVDAGRSACAAGCGCQCVRHLTG